MRNGFARFIGLVQKTPEGSESDRIFDREGSPAPRRVCNWSYGVMKLLGTVLIRYSIFDIRYSIFLFFEHRSYETVPGAWGHPFRPGVAWGSGEQEVRSYVVMSSFWRPFFHHRFHRLTQIGLPDTNDNLGILRFRLGMRSCAEFSRLYFA